MEIIYIPYLPEDHQDFLPVEGILLEQSNPLAIYPDKSVSECSELCKLTLYCSSFYASEGGGNCTLHASNDFLRSQGATGLHVSTDGIFPQKRYMKYNACPVEAAYVEYNTKTRQRCQIRCDNDISCFAFTFQVFQSHNITNCMLHNRSTIIDELFEEKGTCDETEVSIAYSTESFVPNLLDQFEFSEVISIEDLLADECKSLCLHDVDCVALQYSNYNNSTNSSLCNVGHLVEGTDDDDDAGYYFVGEVLVLEVRSPDL